VHLGRRLHFSFICRWQIIFVNHLCVVLFVLLLLLLLLACPSLYPGRRLRSRELRSREVCSFFLPSIRRVAAMRCCCHVPHQRLLCANMFTCEHVYS